MRTSTSAFVVSSMEKFRSLVILLTILQASLGSEQWSKFAISTKYRGFKLVPTSSDGVLALHFYPVLSSILWTRRFCAKDCLESSGCRVFNFYSNDSHHICELLKENYCVSSLRNVSLVLWPTSSIWEKLAGNTRQSCLDQAFTTVPAAQLCETIFPGCTGIWPNCNNCIQTCIDCKQRYSYTGYSECTLRPGGPSTPPIFTSCWDHLTYLMKREVDPSTGSVTLNYMMSLPDMKRLVELKVYNGIQFFFEVGPERVQYFGRYSNPYIDANGALSNLTFIYSSPTDGIDSLKLNGGVLAPAPFISINDGNNSCGSFWRFKPTNNVTCPGGGVGMFGAVVKDANGQVIDTGIHWPNIGTKLIVYGDVGLV